MRAIQVKCSHCAAVLKVATEVDFVDCEYCGTRSTIQRRTRILQMPKPVVRPVHMVAQTPKVALQVVNRARIVVSLLSTLMTFAFIGGIFWFVNKQVEKATGKSVVGLVKSGVGGGGGRMTWLGHGPPLMADIDGDKVPDPIGRVRYVGDGDTCNLAAFSGATGARLWQSAALGSYTDSYQGELFHAGGLILFADPGGSLGAYKTADGKKQWAVSLPDKAERVCRLDAASIAVEVADKSWQTVNLTDGSARKSSGPARCERLADDDDETGDPALSVERSPSLRLDGMQIDRLIRRGRGPTIAVGYKQPGTAVPMLARLDRKRAAWKVEIPAGNPLAARTSSPEFVTVSDTQACAIYEMNSSSAPHLTCFELQSGNRQFDSEVGKGTTIVMEALVWRGGRFFLSSWGHLQVIDGTTGRRLHLIGAL